MEIRRTPLEPEKLYHIYNRGIDGTNIFREERNYPYFLRKYEQYVHPFVETYAYCLLKNHFHLLIKVKTEGEIKEALGAKLGERHISWYVADAFRSLFQSYTQAINKGYRRTGGLFEEPFRRIHVCSDDYFSSLIRYIHLNPQKHGFVRYFRDYPHSSYWPHLQKAPTLLQREKVMEWFGGEEGYIDFHLNKLPSSPLVDIEAD